MSEYRISKQDILDTTQGGLAIFEFYFPNIDLADCARSKKKFKIRDEATPSASIKKVSDGNYIVADFGDDGRWYNGIDFARKRENLDYGETIRLLATRHGVADADRIDSMYDAKFSTVDAKPDQPDKAWYFQPSEQISESHLRILYSKHVCSYFESHDDIRAIADEKERKDAVMDRLRSICTKHHWHSLDSYTIIKNRKAITIEAAEYYPIFCIEETFEKNGKETSFKKIYQPKSKDKGKRFFYHGDFDPQFLHGLNQAKQAFQDLQKQNEATVGDEEEGKSKGPAKLPEIMFCTGGSDALNIAALGYHTTYGSSEYFKLNNKKLKQLFNIAENVMTCPDLDVTGQKQNHDLLMNQQNDKYLDIQVIELPESLKTNRDQYRRPCKDVRDFLDHFTSRDFRNLVRTAKAYRFWDYQQKIIKDEPIIKFGKPVYEYRLSNERILFFIQKCGFCRHQVSEEVKEYIHIDGNVVRVVEPADIKTFLIGFLRKRYFAEELINLVHKSPALNDSSFASLELREVNFTDYEQDSQYFFFANSCWLASKKGVEVLHPLKVNRKVWESKILKHSPTLMKPFFEVTNDKINGLDIIIHNQEDMFFRFLIQTSRIHWRKELEENLHHLPEDEQEKYRLENKFNIDGPNLTDQERRDQKLHLINKIFILGYMLHRYKDPSKPWSPFVMDGKVSDDGQSHGGTGKSIFGKSLLHFKETITFDGRDQDLFKDKHAFELVNKRTDVMLFDDVGKDFPFPRLFSIITGGLTVNKKNVTRQQLSEDETGKILITTNFTPSDIDDSTLRRLIFGEFADYYHLQRSGEYNETRQPIDEFGKNLFKQYDEKEWNLTINFMTQCCAMHFNHGKIEPPSGNIMLRNLIAVMNINFYNWAEVYFSEDSGRRDINIPSKVALGDYVRESGIRGLSGQGFKNKMNLFAKLKNLIFNPKELLNKENRITKFRPALDFDNRTKLWIKTGNKTTLEYYYLRTPGKETAEDEYDPTEVEIDTSGLLVPPSDRSHLDF